MQKTDIQRYRKIRRFFAKIFLHILWWDIILNRPVLRWFRKPALPRWRIIARQYRSLAVEMGGVLIKLGQFLSIRVDILPSEVTGELAGLQDEVPPEKTEDVIAQIEEDFGRPISEIFEWFSPQPLGAASLAQAHLAKIRNVGATPCGCPSTSGSTTCGCPSGHPVGSSLSHPVGSSLSHPVGSSLRHPVGSSLRLEPTTVVVKVLRPGIDLIVETDLAAIRLAFQWIKLYKPIRERVDLDWLADEFTSVTRNELNLKSEGENTERLARDFEYDPNVYIPKVYWKYCAARTLTLENVSYIKISDLSRIESTGISRPQIADMLYNIYMKQVFETYFVHVDPHPGNLFIKPLPHPDEIEAGITDFKPDDPVPYHQDRPFQIVFVDFGMAVNIPERLRKSLREYAVGIGTRDAHKIVQSLVNAGTLLPGADLKRLEEVHEALFERFWGTRVGQFRNLAFNEALDFAHEYRDVIYNAPIQFQADMLFVVRAVGMLSGMAANLDPNFDVWSKTIPFAERYAKEELQKNWLAIFQEALKTAHTLFKLPEKLDQIITGVQRERLVIQNDLTPELQKKINNLEKSIRRLTWIIFAVGLLISGIILHVSSLQDEIFSNILIAVSFITFLLSFKND